MAEYIPKEMAINFLCRLKEDVRFVNDMPTINIVHCSECKYCDEDVIARGVGWCDLFDGARSYDFFCADGERKE